MGMIHGGWLVAKVLKKEGVEVVFTLSGGHIAAIYDGCLREGIHVVDTRHEQAAVHAAEGWAKCTRTPGVALLTAGPGVTDGITGVANAYLAGSPILVIGGAAPLSLWDRGALQEMNQIDLLHPITKWARTVHETARLSEYTSIAFRQMLSGKPGPTFLEMPMDVLNNFVESEASEAYFDPGEPASYRPAGRSAPEAEHVLSAAAILAIGTRMDFRLTHGQPPLIPAEAKLIWFDLAGEDIGANRGAAVGLVGDVGISMSQVAEATRQHEEGEWLRYIRMEERRALERDAAALNSAAVPIHPMRLCREIRDFIDEDTTVVGDGGDIVSYGGRVINVYKPGYWPDPAYRR